MHIALDCLCAVGCSLSLSHPLLPSSLPPSVPLLALSLPPSLSLTVSSAVAVSSAAVAACVAGGYLARGEDGKLEEAETPVAWAPVGGVGEEYTAFCSLRRRKEPW